MPDYSVPPDNPFRMPHRPSVATTLIKALGWSLVSAIAVSMVGFWGHRIGAAMYPQRHEGMPSDLFFFPLGLILGVVVGVMAKLSRPMWGAIQMSGVVALASLGYGGLLYQYARSHSLPPGFTISFEPDPGVAVRCDGGATCPKANPPLEWSVEGSLRVQVSTGLGATVKSISLNSYEMTAYGPRRPTREEVAADGRFAGPDINLEGRQIPGPRHLKSNEVVLYPIRYYYRTRSESAARDIRLHLDFTDDAGKWAGAEALWKVR